MAPARNRVTPLGDIVATSLRGAWTGNRGQLHSGREIVRFHATDLWITCALEFKGWWDEQWRPNRFTWLFFHDEAGSFAAGHRPCALCRRGAYDAYRAGDALKLARYSKRLEGGLLEPWTDYWRLAVSLEDASESDVQAFFAKHGDT